MKKSSGNWLKTADKDLRCAKILMKEHEVSAFIFHLHAAVEKILKGICDETQSEPPRIHNLKKLAVDACELKLEQKQEEILIKLDESFIDSRYPVDLEEFENSYSTEACEELFKEVEVTYKWLKNLLTKN